jgi:hypothetical protein
MRLESFCAIRCALWIFAVSFVTSGAAQDKPLAEIYKTGKIRLVPEITVADASMGGKDFFAGANDVAMDDKGTLYICDMKANNIKKFGATGTFLKTIGKQGQGPGDFNMPIEIEVVGDRLYVRELTNYRFSILDLEGKFIKSISIPLRNEIWWKTKALPDGRFIVHREKTNYENPNALQECFIELYSPDLEPLKTIYHRQIRHTKYITEPRHINVPIPFAPVVYWDVTPDGKVIVGYSEKYEIEIYDPDKGKLSAFSHAYKPVEVTEKDKEDYFKEMTSVAGSVGGGIQTVRKGAPDYIVKNSEFPKCYPAYCDLKVDAEGNIWVHPYYRKDSKDNAPMFDVFDRKGEFINRIQIEGEVDHLWIVAWTPRGFWRILEDEDGEYQIIKCRISELR